MFLLMVYTAWLDPFGNGPWARMAKKKWGVAGCGIFTLTTNTARPMIDFSLMPGRSSRSWGLDAPDPNESLAEGSLLGITYGNDFVIHRKLCQQTAATIANAFGGVCDAGDDENHLHGCQLLREK